MLKVKENYSKFTFQNVNNEGKKLGVHKIQPEIKLAFRRFLKVLTR